MLHFLLHFFNLIFSFPILGSTLDLIFYFFFCRALLPPLYAHFMLRPIAPLFASLCAALLFAPRSLRRPLCAPLYAPPFAPPFFVQIFESPTCESSHSRIFIHFLYICPVPRSSSLNDPIHTLCTVLCTPYLTLPYLTLPRIRSIAKNKTQHQTPLRLIYTIKSQNNVTFFHSKKKNSKTTTTFY